MHTHEIFRAACVLQLGVWVIKTQEMHMQQLLRYFAPVKFAMAY